MVHVEHLADEVHRQVGLHRAVEEVALVRVAAPTPAPAAAVGLAALAAALAVALGAARDVRPTEPLGVEPAVGRAHEQRHRAETDDDVKAPRPRGHGARVS